MISKEILSSFEISLVSNNSCVLIGVKQFAETMVVSTISQNVKRNTAFTLVVRLIDVLLFKEKIQIFLSHSENALVRKNCNFLVII